MLRTTGVKGGMKDLFGLELVVVCSEDNNGDGTIK
jgi:hypothetical protein